MTALHWATFNGDIDTCRHLMENEAEIVVSTQDYTAIDIAGFCKYP